MTTPKRWAGSVDPHFTEEDKENDVVIVVENKRLYTNTRILANESNVFAKLVFESRRKHGLYEIQLNKKYTEIIDLLSYLHPKVKIKLNDRTSMRLIPLAEEYEIRRLRDDCEDYLINSLKLKINKSRTFFSREKDTTSDYAFRCLKIAEKHSLTPLLSQCIKAYSSPRVSLRDLRSSEVSASVKARIYEKRLDLCSREMANMKRELDKIRQEKLDLKYQLEHIPELDGT